MNMVNPLTDWIDENDSSDWTGRQVIYTIHVSRNEGVGASAEGDPLPAAGQQGYAQVKIAEKFNYGRIELTGQVIKSSLQNKGAFTRAMESEVKGLVKDLGNERERQNFGAGNGVLCLVNGAITTTSSTTLTVDSPYGVTPTTNGARFLSRGAFYAVITTGGTTVEGTFTCGNTISSTGHTVVMSAYKAGTTFSDNAYVVRAKRVVGITTDGAYNSINNEPMGLLGLIDDGTYANTLSNINRTTYPIFKSTVLTINGSLSLDAIQRGIDAADEMGGGDFGNNGVFFTGYDTRREYLKLLQPDRRYSGVDLSKPDGGTKKAALKQGGEITYGDRPWKVSKKAPYGTLFGFLKGSITRYIHVRGEWADEDERIFRNVAGYDKWEAFYRIFDNYHSDRPNEGFRLDGITTTVQALHE
ncbi:MAG TPA: phage major capsid protein [Bacteroidetes bacterium]|nr:phage major capsid protein [Bacteroidota bacterium]